MSDLSYQLYSSRSFPPLSETLQILADIGYSQVEGFGGLYDDLPGLAAGLKATGLTMPTGHFSLDMLEGQPDRVHEIAETVGMKAVFCPHLAAEDRPADADGWHAFGARLQKAGEACRRSGLVFGWHNHDFEFQPLADGTVPMEAIFEGGPDLAWEADIAWFARGGADVSDWIARHGHRIVAVHVKDIAPAGECPDEDGWADVGFGTLDWQNLILTLGNTPAQYYVVEHDNPNDHVRFARRSFASVNSY